MKSRALVLALLLAPPALGVAEERVPESWLTPAERADFQATPSYDETIAFLRRLEAQLPEMKLEFYGTSAAGPPPI